MNAPLRVLALLAFLQSAAEGHKTSSISEEAAQAESELSAGQFEAIQSELVNAWKQKSHMQKLRQSLEAEEKLLPFQQSLAEVKLDVESSAAEGQQLSATAAMIRDAKMLLRKSRRDALGKTKKALREAREVKREAEQQIEESSAEIARATKTKEEAVQTKQHIDQVIDAATDEAKYFFNQEVPQLQQGGHDSMGQKVIADSSATVRGKAEQAAKPQQKDVVSQQPAKAKEQQAQDKKDKELSEQLDAELKKKEYQQKAKRGKAEQAKDIEKSVEQREAAKPQQKNVVSQQPAKAKEQQAQEKKDKQLSAQLAAELKTKTYQQKLKKTGGLPEALLQRPVLKTEKDQQATKKASWPAKALVLLEIQNTDFSNVNTSPPLDVLDEQMDELSEQINSASGEKSL